MLPPKLTAEMAYADTMNDALHSPLSGILARTPHVIQMSQIRATFSPALSGSVAMPSRSHPQHFVN